MAYSVSFGSGNTSTSSLSRHTLQARGSLSPCSTCRSNRSLLLIKNIMRWQVWVQRQETFQLFTFSKNLLHMHKDVLYLLIQSRSLKKTCKKACDDVLSHFRQILLGLFNNPQYESETQTRCRLRVREHLLIQQKRPMLIFVPACCLQG